MKPSEAEPAAAIRLGLPSISGPRLYADAGGLLSYGMDDRDNFKLSAAHVVKVANGVSPATLPVETVEYLAPRGRLDYFVDGSKN